jgi:hypothetical protein
VTLFYPQKLALTSSTSGGHSVGVVRSRTMDTELLLLLLLLFLYCYYCCCCCCCQSVVCSYRKFSSGNYALLYHILSTTDCSCVYGTFSVDSAVACLNAVVQDALERAIPRGVINSHLKFPHWYFTSLRSYIKKQNYYYKHFKKRKPTVFTINSLTTASSSRLPSSPTDLVG